MKNFQHINSQQEAIKALRLINDLENEYVFSKDDINLIKKLNILSIRGIHPLQLWIRQTGGYLWSSYRKSKFNEELEKLKSNINYNIYRGTKFPWIQGKMIKFKIKEQIEDKIKEAINNFDKKIIVILNKPMSFTKSYKTANNFASEANNFEVVNGFKLGKGYIHNIIPPIQAVDIEKAIHKIELLNLPNSDEINVAKIEKEVLLIKGTKLIPVERKGRTFYWKIKS